MDMKRILQAMDSVATKPVEGVNSMSKFLRVVKEAEVPQPVAQPATQSPEQIAYNQLRAQIDSADSLRSGNAYADVSPEVTAAHNNMRTKLAQMAATLKAKGIDAAAEYDTPDPAVPAATPVDLNQKYNDQPVSEDIGMSRMLSIVSEGANPHKVALPVQMAMNHYQTPKAKTSKKPSILSMYLEEAEEAVEQEHLAKRALTNQYAQRIAQRVLVKESRVDEKSVSQKQARTMAAAAHDPEFAKKVGIKSSVAKEFNKADTGTKQLSQAMKKKKKPVEEGIFDSKPKVDWNKRAKDLFTKGLDEQQVRAQLLKEGCPPNQVNVYVQAGQLEETPIEMTGDPNDPTIYGHEKANPMSLKGRIMSARAQLKELAQLADSNDLVAWEQICKLAKGGMFMGLEQNLEQIRHGIEQLASKRKQGGVASRGIDKNIGEEYDGEPDEYHVLRHQTKDDIDREITMPAAWTRVKEFDSYQAARRLYNELKEKNPSQKYTITTHSKAKRDAYRKQHGIQEGLKDPKDNPCWKGYKPVGTKKKGGRTVPNCVPKE